jgi:hypothetical protein
MANNAGGQNPVPTWTNSFKQAMIQHGQSEQMSKVMNHDKIGKQCNQERNAKVRNVRNGQHMSSTPKEKVTS